MTTAATGPHRAVIFDLDGTLVDSAKGIAAALDVVRADRGLGPLALDDVRQWVSLGAEELVSRALGSAPAWIEADLAAFRGEYAKIPANPDDLYPGALDTLRALHARGFGLGICTNKPQTLAANLVDGLGLSDLITVVVGGSPDLKAKPHPASLRLVMDRLCTGPTACLYVGDSEVDAATAESAGAPFVLVGHGYAMGPREQIKCMATIPDLPALLPLAQSLGEDGVNDAPSHTAHPALPLMSGLIGRFGRVWRYYGVGIINTLFGYSLFAILVWLHLNVFAAQIIAHVCGATFNYFTYRRLVFADARPAVIRYIGSYAINYLLGLFFLAAFRLIIPSPYIQGLAAMVCVSVANFIILKLFVFRSKAAAE